MEEEESAIKTETIENIIVKPEPFDELLEVDDPLELGNAEAENVTGSKECSDELSDRTIETQATIGKRIIHAPYNENMIINGLEMDVTIEPNIIQAPFSLENYFHGGKQRQSLLRVRNSDEPQGDSSDGRMIQGSTCYDCKIVFDTEEQLQTHMEKHVDFRKMGCNFCNEHLSIQEKLQLHVMTLSGQTKYSCDQCGKSCGAVVRVKQASQLLRPNQIHKCHDCEDEAPTERSEQSHILIIESSDKFACKVCSISFPLASLLETHKQVHALPCKVCQQKFATAHELNEHTEEHLNTRRYVCRYCEMTFTTFNERNVHKQKEHCNQAGKALKARVTSRTASSARSSVRSSNRSSLIKSRNGRECNSPRDFKCRYCDVAYTTSSTLTRHLKEKHNKDKPKFVCELCKKDFSLQKCYDNHMNFHQIAKNYACNVCTLAFLSKFELEQHTRVHDKAGSNIVEASKGVKDSKSSETGKNVPGSGNDSKS